ncbi:hypothetical protein SAMN05428985_102500 [Nocardioides sp. YR527]|uniref:alpha/beta fold hydrolase n=1 Tax=Nocardioides sp. YR527 TaxID=1881028 RepID=UPI0008812AC3|nr:hypothetical protein [Nocardioides sp. YR527]SDK06243.1 hypothetical protein SAMN05428985_102500 [Nocardioides sp. YR527]
MRYPRGTSSGIVSRTRTRSEEFRKAYAKAFEKLPPARVQEVGTSYGRVRAHWFGDTADGVPLVLLPGSGAATPMWSLHLADLTALGHPVLALIGGRTRVHDATRAAARARLMPGATVEVWAEAGHVVDATDPERFAAAGRDHITAHA